MRACNLLAVVGLCLVAALCNGCAIAICGDARGGFEPGLTFSLYNRGGVVSETRGNSEALIETEDGGTLQVEPSMPAE